MLIYSLIGEVDTKCNKMPKYCANCGELKSKSLFVKGRINCKECDDTLSIAGSTMDESIVAGSTMSESIIDVRIDPISTKLDELNTALRDMQRNGTSSNNSTNVILKGILAELKTVRDRLDELKEVTTRLDELSSRLNEFANKSDVPEEVREDNQPNCMFL